MTKDVRVVRTVQEATPPPPPPPLLAARKRLDKLQGRHKKAAKTRKANKLAALKTKDGRPRQRMPKRKPPEQKERLTLHLSQRYQLGPYAYGPGDVVVPVEIGRTLQEQESRARQETLRLRQDRAFVVGVRGAMEIDPASFDEALGRMAPFASVRA